LFGEDAVRVVEVLKGVDEITDNEIADRTQIRLNMVPSWLSGSSATEKQAGLSSTEGFNPTNWKALS